MDKERDELILEVMKLSKTASEREQQAFLWLAKNLKDLEVIFSEEPVDSKLLQDIIKKYREDDAIEAAMLVSYKLLLNNKKIKD